LRWHGVGLLIILCEGNVSKVFKKHIILPFFLLEFDGGGVLKKEHEQ
jgi:hypothetical protein